jgi:hypothetical protein
VEYSAATERWPALRRQPIAASWLNLQVQLGLASRTINAYGRSLADYLTLLLTRPNPNIRVMKCKVDLGRPHKLRGARCRLQRILCKPPTRPSEPHRAWHRGRLPV